MSPAAAATQPARRRYDSTLRREQAAATRERIVAAGVELLRGSSIRDWRAVTIRAVAERAGVNERTVYRHFANERALRDEVLHRLEQRAGIDLIGMGLDDVAGVTARILDTVGSHPLDPRPPIDPTLSEAGRRQRDALRRAVAAAAGGWPEADRETTAGLLDVLWAVAAYERLVTDWRLDHRRAVEGITWVIELIEQAVEAGHGPGGTRPERSA